MAQMGRLETAPRLDVGDEGILVEVVADDLRHVGVQDLVVGHTGARGICDGHVAGPPRRHEAGRAEDRIGVKLRRIEEQIVDPPVDHVDPNQTADGPHVDDVVLDHQI